MAIYILIDQASTEKVTFDQIFEGCKRISCVDIRGKSILWKGNSQCKGQCMSTPSMCEEQLRGLKGWATSE